MPTLKLPVSFKPLTGGETTLSMDGAPTVKTVLDRLVMDHPTLTQRLFCQGRIASWINIYVGDTNIRDLAGVETPLAADDEILVLNAIAGG
ncbi:MoaD/ThiS family protein [Streptomyces sp. MBT27]|uniref:MoaD/ThiS family protein n=1 Tax=Streptomyces sp. MBT27 TaxID=1488356 RepID=UPI00142211E8|nr:MoaD/ThiS family protein [Streptomyces sp. MBT27]